MVSPIIGGIAAGAASGLPGAIASIFGGGAERQAAKGALDFARDSWKDLADKSQRFRRRGEVEAGRADTASRGYVGDERNALLDLAGEGYRRGTTQAAGTFGRNMGDLRRLRSEGLRTSRDTMNQNIGEFAGARDLSVDEITGARDANIGDIIGARDANIGLLGAERGNTMRDLWKQQTKGLTGLAPYIKGGKGGMDALMFNLGLGAAPKGYGGLEMTPGGQFLLNEGLDTIQGGAAGEGGLYSGETIEAAEKLRHGLASTDRAQQIAELFDLAGMGQAASTDAANLRRGFANDRANTRAGYADAVTGERTGAAGALSNERTGAADALAGIYGDYSRAMAGERSDAADDQNALRTLVTGAMGETRDRQLGTQLGLGDAYDAHRRNAQSGYTDSMLGLEQQNLDNLFRGRGMELNALVGAGNTAVPAVSNAYRQLGNAGSAQALGIANSVTGGLMNGLDVYSMMRDWQNQNGGATGGYDWRTSGPMPRPA